MDVELAEIRDFLAEYPPFSLLDAELLDTLPKMLSIRYLRRGSRFPPADEAQPSLYIVRKGAVERRTAAGGLVDTLCEGDLCDVDCLAGEESPVGTAIEDTLVYLIPCARLRARDCFPSDACGVSRCGAGGSFLLCAPFARATRTALPPRVAHARGAACAGSRLPGQPRGQPQ